MIIVRLRCPSKVGGAEPTNRLGRKEPKMIIIGCDYHPGFHKLRLWIPTLENFESGDCSTLRKRNSSTVTSQHQARSTRNESARGGRSLWACALVRATAGGTELRAVDWRCRRDPSQTSTQAEDGSPGCTAYFAFTAGGSLSADLGAERGESGSAATAVAPSPPGASPHPDHEPTASRRPE